MRSSQDITNRDSFIGEAEEALNFLISQNVRHEGGAFVVYDGHNVAFLGNNPIDAKNAYNAYRERTQ